MGTPPRKNVLTTGEVARICSVAPRTVSKWFDNGQLRGYRIPGSKDRRIPVDQLLRFMKAHGIPTDRLDLGASRVLLIDSDMELLSTVKTALSENDGFEVATADTLLEAGVQMALWTPQAVVIDVAMLSDQPGQLCRTCRSHEQLADVKMIGTGNGVNAGNGQSLLQQGFNGFLPKPFNVRQLRDTLDGVLAEA